jgi:protein-S-isoprenylcysteine O-methyltransferase Ste14
MKSPARTRAIAVLVVPSVIILLLTIFCCLGYGLCRVLAIPVRLGLPPPLRFVGLLVLATGVGLQVWVVAHRGFLQVMVSTYETMIKFTRNAPEEPARREEPLVVTGPNRHVRHPMYSVVFVIVTGWWLLLDYTLLLFALGFLFLWFRFVVIPFEERELRALFGAEYEAYAKEAPRFFPAIWRRGRATK